MSNHLAIAAATSTFRRLLEKATEIDNGVKADVTIGRPPSKEDDSARINLYLYQISPNASLRNADLPARRDDGTVVQRPQAAIDLHYLLTFYGKEKDLESQILLGSVIRLLHSQPVLPKDMIRREIERYGNLGLGDAIKALARADLADQIERIRFTPLSLTLDELSKMWSVFFQVPYTLSVAYMASVVLIEADATPQKALPVSAPIIYVDPFRIPVIEEVHPEDDKKVAITSESTVIIRGRQLKGALTRVRIGDAEAAIAADDADNSVSDTAIRISLGSQLFAGLPLRAGVQGIQVLHPRSMGNPEKEHTGFDSNAKPFLLHPTITTYGDAVRSFDATTKKTTVTLVLGFTPKVGKSQRVAALLSQLDHGDNRPRSYSIQAPSNNGITDKNATETDRIVFSLVLSEAEADDLETGEYLVRVQVDGAESLLERDPNSIDPMKYVRPNIRVPSALEI